MSKSDYKREVDATPTERALIERWFAAAHPANHPRNRGTALWRFTASGASLYAGSV